MDVLKVDDLPFLVLLGHDAPDFAILLRDALSPAAAAISNDDEAGPSGMDNDDDMTPGATIWSVDVEFQAAQSTNSMLEAA